MDRYDEVFGRHRYHEWSNDEVVVTVPFSVAGVSTVIAITERRGHRTVLLDAGDGVSRDLLAVAGPTVTSALQLVAVTHGHYDHMGGLYSLLGLLRLRHRTDPLDIVVPVGCVEAREMVAAFRRVYTTTIHFTVRVQEMPCGSEVTAGPFRLQAFCVEHRGLGSTDSDTPWMPALGYRVCVGSTTIAYTGDARMTPGLERAVRGTDLAIIEATLETHEEEETAAHLTEGEARDLAASAKDAILIHRPPQFVRRTSTH